MTSPTLLALATLLFACGGSPSERLCRKAEKCADQGGSDDGEDWTEEDREACISLYDESEASYEEAGCIDEYDDFMDCVLKNAECNEEDGELEGMYEACGGELQALGQCASA